jgi:hypothetical protein
MSTNVQVNEVQRGNRPSGVSRDTSKSDRILQRFQQRSFKAKRKQLVFSGTWETTVEELFPLLCPVREADWIPGWDCELIYTDSGLAEDNCTFKTDKSNAVGEGLWIFIGYEVNQYIEFVRVQEDLTIRARITINDNKDGTVSATWNVLHTGLTKRGNEEIDKLPEKDPPQAGALAKMIDYYLKKGKTINQTSLAVGMVANQLAGHVKGHAS